MLIKYDVQEIPRVKYSVERVLSGVNNIRFYIVSESRNGNYL